MKASVLKSAAIAIVLPAMTLGLCNCAGGLVANTNAAGVNPRALAAESRASLKKLCSQNPTARKLEPNAKGILVFPTVTKGGLVAGAMGGNGVMIRPDGTIRDFYQIAGASYGLQAGIQTYSYAVFLMDNAAFENINRAKGWEIGSSPSLVVVDKGFSKNLSTTTLNSGTYAFCYGQEGLMGGLGTQGTKITRIQPGN